MKKVLLLFGFVIFSQFSFTQSINNFNPILDLGDDFNLCEGYIHILDAGADFDTYLWQDGSTDQTYLVAEAGEYWVHAYLGSTMYADTIQIGYWPYPDPNLGNDTTLCFGEYIVLEAQGSFVSYSWQDGTNLPFYIVAEAGTYWVTVTDAHGCVGSDTMVVDFATPVNLGYDTVICVCDSLLLDAGEGFISYLWQDSSTSQYFLVDGEIYGVGLQLFYVTAVDSFNCESYDHITVYINEYENIKQNENLNFYVHPNPVHDELTIDFANLPNEIYFFKIIDNYGGIVKSGKFRKSNYEFTTQLKINSLEAGIYYLQISNGKTFAAQKILIQ
ncbi:MAG: T9SS type A sorting domain-containing protein [Bacteroidales bacterium]|nr:T9SS type A sorting domain-containing protein [Bacteroidales bacterium]